MSAYSISSWFQAGFVVALLIVGICWHDPAVAGSTITPRKTFRVVVASKPVIVSRTAWGAKRPLASIKMIAHKLRYITIHHSAVKINRRHKIESKMRNLQHFSQMRVRMSAKYVKKAWADVPYHFYVAATGAIAEGRDIRFSGDTNTNYNPVGHIQIVLEGNFEKEKPSTAQISSLHQLVGWLAAKWKIPTANIKGHNDHASTACPGKNMKRKISELRAVRSRN